MENHFHSLQEAKVYVNAKTPYTLASLTEGFLKKMRDNPDVPPSMKERLETALSIKKEGVKGGLAGVSKASGFIQRMMAENKKKHSGQYKKPTDPAHKDSKMSSWRPFDYKKLANSTQSGANTSEYGASPFIQKYFKNGTVKFESGNTAKETEAQRKARLLASVKLLLKRSKQLVANKAPAETIQEVKKVAEEAKNELVSLGEPPKGIEISPKPATPANPEKTTEVIKIKPPPEKVANDKKTLAELVPEWEDLGDYTDKMTDREFNLTQYVYNYPTGKLAGAIDWLKDAEDTKGIAPGTVSPQLKKAKEKVEEITKDVIAKMEKATGKETNFKKIRSTLKEAFKGEDVDKYVDAWIARYKHIKPHKKDLYSFYGDISQIGHLRYSSAKGGFRKYYTPKTTSILLNDKTYDGGFNPEKDSKDVGWKDNESQKYTEHYVLWKKAVEVKDESGNEVKGIEDTIRIGGLYKNTKTFTTPVWVINHPSISLTISGKRTDTFKKPQLTREEDISNSNKMNSGRMVYGNQLYKPTSRVFYLKGLYEDSKEIEIGELMLRAVGESWHGTKSKASDMKYYKKVVLNKLKHLTHYEYTLKLNGAEYVSPYSTDKDEEEEEEVEGSGMCGMCGI